MPETKTKAHTPAEPAAENENEVAQAARTWTDLLRDAGRTIADAAVAMQDRNVHFTQSVVDQGFKQVEDQTEAMRKLYVTLSGQSDARRAAFRDLGREAVEAYMGFLATPLRIARRSAETLRETAEQTARTEA